MSGFAHDIAGGNGNLIATSVQSPNFVSGMAGWQISRDGTAQFNQLTLIVQTSGAAVLIYAGSAGSGTLIGSWANAAGTDAYGNNYPAGLYAVAGSLSGLTITSSSLVACTITQALLNAPTITQAAQTGGTMTETAITFDSTGGSLLVYTTTTTTVTLTSGTSWTAPAGNYTSGKVECWGADAGGGGGGPTVGGEAGGGGAYSCEPAYPLTPGAVYQTQIGQGGTGGTSGNAGTSGGQTAFDQQGVIANGGQAGSGGTGGLGGAASAATISHPGGNGGNGNLGTASAGGGGRAGSTGAGGNGGNGGGSPGAAGAAGTGTGGVAGGAGVAANTNGNSGGAGSGAGASSGSTQGTKTYRFTASETYYGSDTSGNSSPNGQKNSGTMSQGGTTASGGSFNGTMKSLGLLPSSVQTDLAGVTIDSVTLRLRWLNTWYNSGAYVILSYTNFTSFGSTWTGTGETAVATWWQGSVGSPVTTDLSSSGLGAALQSGAAKSLALGPGSPGYDLYNYGSMYGAGGDAAQNPLLTVNYHTGAAPKQGGAGANGVIKITYASSTTLVASISPAAGTDSAGNKYPMGVAGVDTSAGTYAALGNSTNSFSPASLVFGALGSNADTQLYRLSAGVMATPGSISGVDTSWVAVGMVAGWVARASYPPPQVKRMAPQGLLWVQMTAATNNTVTNGIKIGTFGAGYFNGTSIQSVIAQQYTGSATVNASQLHIEIDTSGNVNLWGITSSSGGIGISVNGFINLVN